MILLPLLWGCPAAPAKSPDSGYLAQLRQQAPSSTNAELVGTWLLSELVASGGDLRRAAAARERLGTLRGAGPRASLAQAVDADVHGQLRLATQKYLQAIAAGRDSAAPETAAFAWFATLRLNALRAAVSDSWQQAEPVVMSALSSPGNLGWRARGELVEWWGEQALAQSGNSTGGSAAGGSAAGGSVPDELAARHGCLRQALMAGPFGRGVAAEHRIHFEAERPAPWPARFEPNRRRLQHPQTLAVESHGCLLTAKESAPAGVYYVQLFLDLPATQDVIIAVQGAFAVFVDDHEVLTRDAATWGVWPRYGVKLRLRAGRHRLLGRLGAAETRVQVLRSDGLPLGIEGSADQAPLYSLTPPERLDDPNVLEPFLRHLGVPPQGGRAPAAVDVADPVVRYICSYLAHVEGQDDLATVILEPLTSDRLKATPVSLAQQAVYSDGDPIYPKGKARDVARELRKAASDRDPELWGPKLWLVLENADRESPTEVVRQLEALTTQFPEVPFVVKRLANIYGRLGWPVEHGRTVELAAKRFPADTDVLKALLRVHERRGELAAAEAVAARIRRLDPTEEVSFQRALERRDYQGAIAELKRIGELRQDRQDIAFRIADLLVRAGQSRETMAKLELALAKDPFDAQARMALADERYAQGNRQALTDALVEAIRTGAESDALRAAIELTEGMTDLEPYRRDGLEVIAQHEASGVKMPGTASRVLDYAALWVAPDGSARMLEHEIIKIQSREAIAQHAEQSLPQGIVLRMRTIKQDGRILEPELVAAKPTVTMPHLEVGDYIETEHLWVLRGDGEGGRAFIAPRWLFREKGVAYHWSELLVVSPKSRPLSIETTGEVPEPTVTETGALVIRRWVVSQSPALPEEPASAPIEEFLPSVQVGWGFDLEERVRRLVDQQEDSVPLDPRITRIVAGALAKQTGAEAPPMRELQRTIADDERARRLYRRVLDTIQPGSESQGPQVIMGGEGNRTQAFLHLCKHAGLDARLGLVQSRLSPPALGPFSQAMSYDTVAVRLKLAGGNRWLVVRDKYTPYGYLPSSLRGQPAVMIQLAEPRRTPQPVAPERDTTPLEGSADGVVYQGTAALRADGSAQLELTQRFEGGYAIGVRKLLVPEPPNRRKDVVEAQLLGLDLAAGNLTDLTIQNLEQLDEPLVLQMRIDVPNFARRAEGGLVVEVPFLPQLGGLGRLPARETPLYLSEGRSIHVRLDVKLSAGMYVAGKLTQTKASHGRHQVTVADHLDAEDPRLVHLDRFTSIPAGRVQPDEYPAFRAYVQQGGAALSRPLRIKLD